MKSGSQSYIFFAFERKNVYLKYIWLYEALWYIENGFISFTWLGFLVDFESPSYSFRLTAEKAQL